MLANLLKILRSKPKAKMLVNGFLSKLRDIHPQKDKLDFFKTLPDITNSE